jgi:hypothetical protein
MMTGVNMVHVPKIRDEILEDAAVLGGKGSQPTEPRFIEADRASGGSKTAAFTMSGTGHCAWGFLYGQSAYPGCLLDRAGGGADLEVSPTAVMSVRPASMFATQAVQDRQPI